GIVVANDDGKAYMRGMGHTVSARAFGHNGAGGQIAWADPETGLSFCDLTDGLDRHIIRESRRVSGVASRAALLTTPMPCPAGPAAAGRRCADHSPIRSRGRNATMHTVWGRKLMPIVA